MAALTFDALLRNLKKKGAALPPPDPVYLLHGDEDVLKDEAIRLLVDVAVPEARDFNVDTRSEEHTSELQSHSFISYAVFCLKKKTKNHKRHGLTSHQPRLSTLTSSTCR